MASALSSLVFSASANSLTRIWRALASIRFSPADKPRSLLATEQVADHFGNLDDIAGGELLEVGLVAPGPVSRLLGVGLAQDAEDFVEALGVHNITNTHKVDVVGRYPDRQIALGDSKYEVLAFDSPLILRISTDSMTAAPWCG
jgi:hypothetical protein